MKKKDMPVRLVRDGIDEGVFNNEKQAKKYIFEWEYEYYNQDEFDMSYKPHWEFKRYEEEYN